MQRGQAKAGELQIYTDSPRFPSHGHCSELNNTDCKYSKIFDEKYYFIWEKSHTGLLGSIHNNPIASLTQSALNLIPLFIK